MKLTRVAAKQLQKRLPKVIDARTHGFIDYAHSAFFFAVGALLWHKNRRAAATALGTGGFLLAQSLLTDYPLGAAPVLSFSDHGKIDAGLASASFVLPRVFGFAGTPEARIFEASGIVTSGIVGMTDWDNAHAHDGSSPHDEYWNYTADSRHPAA